MEKFIPFPFSPYEMPIDISCAFADERPAGKHGFLSFEGERFVFEDGTPVRFWGVNLNGGANFPEHDYAERLARRLAMTGVNLVRFHQLDAEWNTPNIFSFCKGPRVKDTRHLDERSMERLDYLIYCLKREGIYCYMDMMTYRKFKSGDGIHVPHKMYDSAKSYSMFDEHMIALEEELAEMLWGHVNPYTGLRYADDPVFVLAEISNENDLFVMADHPQRVLEEPYVSDFRNQFRAWLTEEGIEYDADACDINASKDEPLLRFKMALQEKYYRRMEACLRRIGVKIPVTGNNWRSMPANIRTQLWMDYIDGHCYNYDWRWGEYEKRCANVGITEQNFSYLFPLVQMNVKGKPFYVSEWDMPWPNEYRAESPIYNAAVGLLQGWSGFCIHTYAYTSRLREDNILGKEISASKIGGTPYREGIFSTWNDPAKYGLFYHAALMTRRGDVAPAKKHYVVRPASLSAWNNEASGLSAEISRMSSQFDEQLPDGVILTDRPLATPDATEIVSDTGELYRNLEKKYGTVNTAMTKCAYGFLGNNEPITLGNLTVDCKTDFAVIALSSLTDDEIGKSDNMLLTTVGRARNTDAKFDGDLLVDYGRSPALIESIEATVRLATEKEGLQVWAVSAEGLYIGKVPTTYEGGVLEFRLGEISRSMYYLIVEE